jgi:hypothetical protein
LALVSCKKDKPDSSIIYSYLNAELKNDYSFQKGSYWVYQDQSLKTDSIILSNYETGFTSLCPDNACPRREFIKLGFENVTQGTAFNHYLLSDFIRYNGGGEWGEDGQPVFLLDRNEGYGFNGLVVGQNFDSLVVMSKTFYDVKIMSIIADKQYQDEFDYNTDFYFSPSVGIIKYVVYDTLNGTETWELKNYKIE